MSDKLAKAEKVEAGITEAPIAAEIPPAAVFSRAYQEWMKATKEVLCYDDDFLIRVGWKRGDELPQYKFFMSKKAAEDFETELKKKGFVTEMVVQPNKQACNNLGFLYKTSIIPESVERKNNFDEALKEIATLWKKTPVELAKEKVLLSAECRLKIIDRFGRIAVGAGFHLEEVKLVYEYKGTIHKVGMENISKAFHKTEGMAETRAIKRAISSIAIFDRRMTDELDEGAEGIEMIRVDSQPAIVKEEATAVEATPVTSKKSKKTEKQEDALAEEETKPPAVEAKPEEKVDKKKPTLLAEERISDQKIIQSRRDRILALGISTDLTTELKNQWLAQSNLGPTVSVLKDLTDAAFDEFLKFLSEKKKTDSLEG